MRYSNEMYPVEATRTRPRTWWEIVARKALDSWAGGTEQSVAAGIEDGYRAGIAFAAKFIEGKGQADLARAVKSPAEDAS